MVNPRGLGQRSQAHRSNLERRTNMTTSTLSRVGIPTGTWKVDKAHTHVGFAVSYMGIVNVCGESAVVKLPGGKLHDGPVHPVLHVEPSRHRRSKHAHQSFHEADPQSLVGGFLRNHRGRQLTVVARQDHPPASQHRQPAATSYHPSTRRPRSTGRRGTR